MHITRSRLPEQLVALDRACLGRCRRRGYTTFWLIQYTMESGCVVGLLWFALPGGGPTMRENGY